MTPIPFSKVISLVKGAAAAGLLSLSRRPADGDTVTIHDGTSAKTYEFDTGGRATGTIALSAQPADTNTITINDGSTTIEFEFDIRVAAVAASGSVVFATQPDNGDKIVIGDGSLSKTFEFSSDIHVAGSNILVPIEGNVARTVAKLISSINTSGLAIVASSSAASTVVLTHQTAGIGGNVTITKTDANDSFSVTGMANGAAASNNGLAGAGTRISIGSTVPETLSNIATVINASALTIKAEVISETSIHLLRAATGTGGNQAITKSGANITVTGMSGGGSGGLVAAGSNVAVQMGATATISATSLHTAITGESTSVTSTDNGNGSLALANTIAKGSTGNQTITKSSSAMTVSGMAGGTDMVVQPVLADAEVGAGKRALVTGFVGRMEGSAFADLTSVDIEDNAESPIIFSSIAKTALSNNSPVHPFTSNVTNPSTRLPVAGGGIGKGITVRPKGSNEGTGGTLHLQISGLIIGS